MSDQPYTFDQATRLVNDSKAAQRAVEDLLRQTFATFAQKEHDYRVELAKEIVRQHADGVAWTACQDLARGDTTVARLRMERDVADGVKEAALQQAWRASADRRDLTQLITWSMRRDLAEGYGDTPIGEGRMFGSSGRAV